MAHYAADNPSHIGTQVFLNGEHLPDVIECDTESGWAVVACRDEKGYLKAAPDGESVATKRIIGNITAIQIEHEAAQ